VVNFSVDVLKCNKNRREDTASDPWRQMRKNHFSKSHIMKQLWYKRLKLYFPSVTELFIVPIGNKEFGET